MARQAVTDPAPASAVQVLATLDVDGQQRPVYGRVLDGALALGEINLDDIAGEVEKAGAFTTWWGVVKARARGDAARAKRRIKVVEGQQGKAHRQRLARDPGAKITDAIIKELVQDDPECEAAEQAAIRAQEQADIAEAAYDSVRERQRTISNLVGALAREVNASHAAATLRLSMQQHAGEMKRGRSGI